MGAFSVVLLVLIGLGLIMAEIYLLSGMSVTGFIGLVCLAGGVHTAYTYVGTMEGHITLVVALILCVLAVWMMMKKAYMAYYKGSIERNLIEENDIQVGDKGICISRLSPMGKVRIGNVDIPAKSAERTLDAGTHVEVTEIAGQILIVRTVKK